MSTQAKKSYSMHIKTTKDVYLSVICMYMYMCVGCISWGKGWVWSGAFFPLLWTNQCTELPAKTPRPLPHSNGDEGGSGKSWPRRSTLAGLIAVSAFCFLSWCWTVVAPTHVLHMRINTQAHGRGRSCCNKTCHPIKGIVHPPKI